MENSYGIGISNRYEILGEEDTDPCEVIEKEEKKNKKKEVKTKKVGKENTDKARIEERAPNGRNVKFSTTSREDRNNRRNREETDNFQRESAPRFDSDRGRGRGRGGRGRGRGRGRGFGNQNDGFDSRGKREFDRMSGSDKSSVKSIEKRDGGGAHNWGKHVEIDTSINDASFEFESGFGNSIENIKQQDDSIVENEPPKGNDEGAPEGADEETPDTQTEPLKEMTLDEWKAKQGERQRPTFNIRKAGEGEEGSNWKKGYVVHQKKADTDSEEEYDDDDEFVPRGRQKKIVNINIEFSEPRSLGGRGRGRGRGGRGEGRGRGTRVFNRGNSGRIREDRSSKQSAPRVDDEKDFPSL